MRYLPTGRHRDTTQLPASMPYLLMTEQTTHIGATSMATNLSPPGLIRSAGRAATGSHTPR